MKIFQNKTEMHDFLKEIRKKRRKIGFIPTMGSIHEGHLSLIDECKKLGYYSLVSIFINPTQFSNPNDYDLYPRNNENDKKNLKSSHTELLFMPSIHELYSKGVKTEKTIFEFRNILCDKFRPNHFDGVTTIVKLLFEFIQPDHVFFGEKDFQQLKIIQKVIDVNNYPIIMHSCPSIRMQNGMSFSSRYNNFTTFENKIFNIIAKLLLQLVISLKKKFNFILIQEFKKKLNVHGIKKIDYIEIREEIGLQKTMTTKKSRLFVAFYIGSIRVIDNFILY